MTVTIVAPDHISASFKQYGTVKTNAMAPEVVVSSPYLGDEHHLDLSSVPEPSQQLAKALSSLRPVTNDYPSQPYPTSFNWQEIINQLPSDFVGTSPLPPAHQLI
jgi:hypothetical protein